MLEATQLTVERGGRRILREVELAVRRGELLVLLGPNGAGKSTLLSTLAGELAPSSGGVTLEGRPLQGWSSGERARRIAVLPQEAGLRAPFTALEVVLLGRAPHQPEARRVGERIAAQALAATGTSALAARNYLTLSGGERQRVQLARVLAQIWEEVRPEARFLLLDEPTSSLDLAHQHATLEVAKRFAAEGVGVIAAVHDLNLAARYADRIAILSGGAIVAEGVASEVLTEERLRTVYGVSIHVTTHPLRDEPLVLI